MLRHEANGRGGGQAGGNDGCGLKGKKIIIPAMASGAARAFAAAFRAIGLDAEVTPPSDHRTLELGARYTCGDECYPAKITVGDFMKVLEQQDTDPSRIVLLMANADGPCRFGQYAPYLRRLLDANGYRQTELLAPSTDNPYALLGDLAGAFVRTAWRALLGADILHKLLLRCRPYEQRPGSAESVYEESTEDLCRTIGNTPVAPPVQMQGVLDALVRARDRFRSLPLRPDPATPLIGIVGEVFCRLNTFSNENLVRRLEALGAEAWLSDFTEFLWYMNAEQSRYLKLQGRWFSLETLGNWLRRRVQHRDEHRLLEPFRQDFAGREEADISQVLEYARPYLPADGAMGEMVVSVGKIAHLARQGVHGIIDISPFTCMNGIVSEAIYPRLSRDLAGLPIRNFYFDGTQSDLDRDLGVFLELARTHQRGAGQAFAPVQRPVLGAGGKRVRRRSATN